MALMDKKMGNLRTTINTNRNEENWVDFPIHSKILLDDIKQTIIKKEGPNPNYSYLIYNYHDLDILDIQRVI